jgi:hypothetical protein
MSTAAATLPWPVPQRCARTGATSFAPRVGNTTRRFARMADATDYETGVHCRKQGLGLLDDASAATRLGWCDEDTRQPSMAAWSTAK